ncbi:hypothetical protein MVEN_00818400 [Mycena venus]|uniref:DUF7918 domain-containing protein n=1 Tax=Mycena venus TaxID=2733690 RepID=A0A8H6YGT9_9AGAR|nr:hypothetical protein MVEN_00818400 [Mycena venus]
MDGKFCRGKIIYATRLPHTTMIDGVTDGSLVRPFMFSLLDLTDDDAFLADLLHPNLGLIELTIWPVQFTEYSSCPLSPHHLSEIKVHERVKKAVTQQISLANPELMENPIETFAKCEPTGPEIVTFRFKYRPLDVLRANGILPPLSQLKRKASSEPSRAETPDDTADAEEEKTLRERLRALKSKRLEKKNRLHAKNNFVDLTQERKNPGDKPKFIHGEIIDLT